jgi:hypothetical protein
MKPFAACATQHQNVTIMEFSNSVAIGFNYTMNECHKNEKQTPLKIPTSIAAFFATVPLPIS